METDSDPSRKYLKEFKQGLKESGFSEEHLEPALLDLGYDKFPINGLNNEGCGKLMDRIGEIDHSEARLERVKKKVTEEADRKSKNLEKLKESEVLTELNTLHTSGVELVDPTDKSGSFRGRDKLYDHLSSMIKNAEKEIILATTADGFQRS